MRPEEQLDWLFERQRVGWTLGLDRVKSLLRLLGEPQQQFRAVLVGGTNGKGSVAAALACCFTEAGFRTGLYTSPHLSRVGERFRIDGAEATRAEVAAVVSRVRPAAEEVGASFFEVVTAAACLHFAASGVRMAVMEVGLGGRFDATNALEPELSLITGVSLDHTAILGDTVAAIAGEKAGIMRPERLTITGARGEALRTLRGAASEMGARLWVLGDEIAVQGAERGWQGVRFRVDTPVGSLEADSPLVGAHQLNNLALAASAALACRLPVPAIISGLGRTRWPGRLERFSYGARTVILDGAHNPEAAGNLAGALARLGVEEYVLVLGMGRDREPSEIAAPLLGRARAVVTSRALLSPRARPAADLAQALGPTLQAARFEGRLLAVDDPAQALARALELAPEGVAVVVAGSLYLIGEVRPLITGEELERDERWQ